MLRLLPIWKAITLPLPRLMSDRNSVDSIIALAAALELGDIVGYLSPNLSATHPDADLLTAIVWDIHSWGVRCVAQEQRELLEIKWQNVCPPF